ncbi:protein twist [Anopheles funestus]|uniref:protein twist n=1 Tax=Anopheles funestus TaxID=62324 RepID=UPI0020C5FFC2|nr:protein twist [Anopheles funestus]
MYNKMSSYETASSDGDLCHRVCDPDQYYESNGSYYTQLYPADSQNSGAQVTSAGGGGGVIIMDEEGYWGSPCSSSESHPDIHRDRYSPPTVAGTTVVSASGNASVVVSAIRNISQQQQHQPPDQSSLSTSSLSSASSTSSSMSASSSPYGGAGHPLPPGGYHQQQHHHHQQMPSSMYCSSSSIVYEKSNAGIYVPDEGYFGATGTSIDPVSGTTGNEHQSLMHMAPSSSGVIPGNGVPVVRVVKRRNTANKKERRRTQSINSAYTSLRDRIPNVPNDTKLSKIKTLRLAISYIAHLLAVVNGNQDPSCDFRAELVPSSRKINAERRAQKTLMQNFTANGTANGTVNAATSPPVTEGRKIKGRTGWPQHVWALETKTTIK